MAWGCRHLTSMPSVDVCPRVPVLSHSFLQGLPHQGLGNPVPFIWIVCPSSQLMCPLFADTEGGVRGRGPGDGAFPKTLITRVLSEIWKNLSLHSGQLTRKTQACLRI